MRATVNYGSKEIATRLRNIHKQMRRRCERKTNKDFIRYGARGISVCPEWKSITGFAKWALNNGYEQHLSIDRIDNNKGYYPENCRWVTDDVQQRNKRNVAQALGQPALHWAEMLSGIYGEKVSTINKRIRTRLNKGWDEGLAVFTPRNCKPIKACWNQEVE